MSGTNLKLETGKYVLEDKYDVKSWRKVKENNENICNSAKILFKDEEKDKDNYELIKQEIKKEIIDDIRQRLKKVNFNICDIYGYSYTENFLEQVEKGDLHEKI